MGKMMSSPILIPIIVVLLILDKSTISCLAIKNNVTFHCFPREREALLRFKASFSDDQSNNMLSSWKANSDCCAWPGVECDNARHVVGLHLRNKDPWDLNKKIHNEAVDSSLLELKYLSYLDLSGNDFRWSPIPSFLGSMKHLQYLNLPYANFAGVVPHQLGNLSSLHTLDLGGISYIVNSKSLIVDDLTWAINLRSLEYLDMSYVNLSATKDPLKVLNMLPSLVELSLSNCGLNNTNLALTTSYWANFTLFINNLQHLDLSHNSFGKNFSFGFLHNMTSLSFLDISFNNLHDSIPSFVGDLRVLRVLRLNNNNLFGSIPSTFGNLKELQVLNLGANILSGPIPSTFGNLRELTFLNLGSNKLSGPIKFSLENLRALRELDVADSHLSGEIPISLGQLSNLERVYISFNALEGTLSEAHFAKLSKLELFDVRSNLALKLRVGYDWVPPFHQLNILRMGSVEIGGQFPQWLQTQKPLIELSLSNCSITGTLPKWLSSFMNLRMLDLSTNHIEGTIPDLPSSLGLLDLSKNFINGPIPDSLCEIRYSGSIQEPTICDLYWLQLNNNSITGEIPSSLQNCSWLFVLDIGDNMLYGKLPEWIGNRFSYLVALRLRNNKFYGDIPTSYCRLHRLQIMDIANNQLTGNIPNCFGNLLGMLTVMDGEKYTILAGNQSYGVSLSEMMNGAMLEYTSTLKYLVNLDLSSNRLSGKIPDTTHRLEWPQFATGVATGFWGYVGVLIVKRSWRLALFRHMDTLIRKMLGRY
ncbi:hypothetical protein CASFOL_002575 [Castilleja foliolosa]|uniref:Leucine-rich repeat-containing N-terminal plant-type domain-containing protein n=1 Tax=Castilleja foliolosa TaxID=1961234 RepID=A0ABD3EIN5_9LAMI